MHATHACMRNIHVSDTCISDMIFRLMIESSLFSSFVFLIGLSSVRPASRLALRRPVLLSVGLPGLPSVRPASVRPAFRRPARPSVCLPFLPPVRFSILFFLSGPPSVRPPSVALGARSAVLASSPSSRWYLHTYMDVQGRHKACFGTHRLAYSLSWLPRSR